MLNFRQTMGGLDVRVNDAWVGCIDKEGFFIPSREAPFVRITPAQLRDIAARTEKHMQTKA